MREWRREMVEMGGEGGGDDGRESGGDDGRD